MVTVEEIRRAQRAEGPATILAIGTATPSNCVDQSTYPDYYFRITDSEHKTELKEKFKRMCKILYSFYFLFWVRSWKSGKFPIITNSFPETVENSHFFFSIAVYILKKNCVIFLFLNFSLHSKKNKRERKKIAPPWWLKILHGSFYVSSWSCHQAFFWTCKLQCVLIIEGSYVQIPKYS